MCKRSIKQYGFLILAVPHPPEMAKVQSLSSSFFCTLPLTGLQWIAVRNQFSRARPRPRAVKASVGAKSPQSAITPN